VTVSAWRRDRFCVDNRIERDRFCVNNLTDPQADSGQLRHSSRAVYLPARHSSRWGILSGAAAKRVTVSA
jgi:hypothetical protein